MRALANPLRGTCLALVLASGLLALLSPAQAGAPVRSCGAETGAGSRSLVARADVDRAVRADPTSRFNACGRMYVAEAAQPTPSAQSADATTRAGRTARERRLPAPLSSTFELESLPGSNHTIYLDFDGASVAGTAFNADYALPLVTATPFSMTPPADTSFTTDELAAIQRAWQVVAEDFAPFDVNVTTARPEADALSRTSAYDTTWGVTVVATTAGGPLQTACRCGGLAYVGGVGETGPQREYHQPGFVFGAVSREGVGEAISHEVGHMFGLFHDGTTTQTYYDGSEPWAPIMGTGYRQPVTQWSAGEYVGANNDQDDVALIARYAPFRRDDHGDTAATATPLRDRVAARGLITNRDDVDAFSFIAGGRVSISIVGRGAKADLDVSLRILDAQGAEVALVRPATRKLSPSWAEGMGARWTARLPGPAATYTVLVDGVGSGDPLAQGGYSDYGSMGAYRVVLRTLS